MMAAQSQSRAEPCPERSRRGSRRIINRQPVLSRSKGSPILWLAFTAVLLIAFFFRFYRLADHPLGLFWDPSVNGLDAVRLMQRGGHAVFMPTNGGREALVVYLLIPFIWLFDTTPFAVRALTATTGLLTIALLFGFLKAVSCLDFGTGYKRLAAQLAISSSWSNGLCLAPLAGLILATSYWHIAVSRLGVRAVLVAVFSVPMFWFFLKGWAGQQKRWFVLSGLLMGLAGYTYFAARLLPLILVLSLIPEFFDRPKQKIGKYGPGLLVFIGSALAIYLPMAWYLVTHPAQFTARAFSVIIWNFLDTPAAIIAEMGRNALRALGFFCCAGSPNPIFGLPGWPGLPFVLTPFLLLGLAFALKQWRHIFCRLLALWWLVGVAPSLVTIEAPHPLRMIVAVVPTAVLIAFGLINTANWLQARFTFSTLRWLPLALILTTLPGTFRAYFIDWTRLQTTQGIYDYGAIAIRDAILDHAGDETPLYVPLARLNDSPLLFYLSGPFARRAALETSPAESALVIAPEKNAQDPTWLRLQNHTATVLPPLTGAGQRLIKTALADPAATPIQTGAGEIVARLAALPADPAQFLEQPTHRLEAVFGPVRLTGGSYSPVIAPQAGNIPFTLFWQALAPINNEYDVILHLVDDQRRVWGDGSGRPIDWVYPTTFWRPGLDEIAARHNVILTEQLAPGRYWLAVSLFDPATGRRLPLTHAHGDSPDTFFAGPLKAPLPPPDENIPPLEQEVIFGDVAKLSGFQADQLAVTAGEPVKIALLWEAVTPSGLDYTVFVHLLDANLNLVAGYDAQPLDGHYPTSIWSAGERILDPHVLPLPASLPPGQYHLALGLYHQPTGERLPLHVAGGGADAAGRLFIPQPVIVIKK
ncbi:MAG: hypothetical protein JW953_09815 [Anaerolineae bacterium]|nr:hypothetical protein [Anaerolineae bacterium]